MVEDECLRDGLIVSALVVVNPLGDVIDPATGKLVAGVRTADGRGFADARLLIRGGTSRTNRGDNSTVGVVATNARLTKAQASYIAQLADDGKQSIHFVNRQRRRWFVHHQHRGVDRQRFGDFDQLLVGHRQTTDR